MLKRISTDSLVLGMYVHELCGSWLEHPFWRTTFKLTDPKDLRRIRESGVSQLWIDTDQGLDLPSGQNKDDSDLMVEEQLVQVAAVERAQVRRTSLAEELRQAQMICTRSRAAVAAMFRDARMGNALDIKATMPLVENITESVARNANALISLARLKTKDNYTYMHSVAVCGLMVGLGNQLGLDTDLVRQAGVAGLLHDIGKMGVPDRILNKPGKLTDEEFAMIRAHPESGWRMLSDVQGISDPVLDVCLHHHEKVDGTGYPHGLRGDAISLFARMGAVCDVYDAITSDRAYKPAWTPGEALRKMTEWRRGHFDEMIFQAFVKTVGIYPVGSLVRLASDRLAVVIDQSEGSLLRPRVKAFYSVTTQMQIAPVVIDLATHAEERILGLESPAKWRFRDLDNHWRY